MTINKIRKSLHEHIKEGQRLGFTLKAGGARSYRDSNNHHYDHPDDISYQPCACLLGMLCLGISDKTFADLRSKHRYTSILNILYTETSSALGISLEEAKELEEGFEGIKKQKASLRGDMIALEEHEYSEMYQLGKEFAA